MTSDRHRRWHATGSADRLARGLARDERQRLEQVLADLEQQLFGAGVARQRVDARDVDEQRAGRQRVAREAGGHADAALDVQDLEAAVVEQLPHAPFGRDEVVRVVHVPEERALLQVVGDDDEEDAAGPQRAQRFGGEVARAPSMPRHVLEHLIGVDDVGAARRRIGIGGVHDSMTARPFLRSTSTRIGLASIAV